MVPVIMANKFDNCKRNTEIMAVYDKSVDNIL